MARASLFPPKDLYEAILIPKTIWENNGGAVQKELDSPYRV